MKSGKVFVFGVLGLLTACVYNRKDDVENVSGDKNIVLKRYLAQVTDDEPAFWIRSYIIPKETIEQIAAARGKKRANLEQKQKIVENLSEKEKAKLERIATEKIDLKRWLKNAGEGYRGQKLYEMYRANTREFSNRLNKHVACFTGNAETVQNKFFDSSIEFRNYRPMGKKPVKVSSDLQMMGISFEALTDRPGGQKVGDRFHFRIANCVSSGKSSILKEEELVENLPIEDESSDQASVSKNQRKPASAADGFEIFDTVSGGIPKNLPTFTIRSDSDIPKDLDETAARPWRGMNISDPKQAEKFAILLQKYFYEGMYDQNKSNPNMNFIAKENKVRYWCHMPWLNVGNSGREAIHGLTMERDLARSPMYPQISPGTDWGVAYYNAVGCKTIRDVFYNGSKFREEPEFTEHKFENGAMSVKILFTQANFPAVAGAYRWTANVSASKLNVRSLQTVRHIQMDIGLKDSSLVGTLDGNEHWVMVTYYYDSKYTNKALTDPKSEFYLKNLPTGLARMRPQGVQVGFEENNTILFSGAVTNSVTNDFKNPKPLKHLNGPADNARTNCFACHGTAGTQVSMVPGVMTNSQYLKVKGDGLDFSQQLALARRNFETAPEEMSEVDAVKPAGKAPARPEQ